MKSFLTSAAGLAIAAALAVAPAMASDNTMFATLVAKADGEGDAAVKGDASLKALTFGTWGVDLAARDTNVKPGDDFDRYANGGWF